MKTLIIISAALVLSACDALPDSLIDVRKMSNAPAEEIKFNMPAELNGCKTFRVPPKNPAYNSLVITRCPLSVTTTHYGRGQTVVVDPNPAPPDEDTQ